VFVTVNRNKRSAAIDLAGPEGRAAFERLVTVPTSSSRRYRAAWPSGSGSTGRGWCR